MQSTHSYWHRQAAKLTPAELRDDLKRSIDVLESQTGQKVLGFRAPSFSITPGSERIFDLLLDLGLAYDASLFPAIRGHGGYRCSHTGPYTVSTPNGRSILELPMSVFKMGPLRVPFSGGGYLRLLPKCIINYAFHQLNAQGSPVVVYLPRDFAPECPRLPLSLRRKFKSYVGLKSTAGKLEMLLRYYRFTTCSEVLGLNGAAPQQIAEPHLRWRGRVG